VNPADVTWTPTKNDEVVVSVGPPAGIVAAEEKPAEPNGKEDCFGSYTASLKPFFQMMLHPVDHLNKGYGGVFKCWPFHEDFETNILAFGTWMAFKIWIVVIAVLVRLIIVGIVIGWMGNAITGMLIGLIVGFLCSHTVWWIITRMDGCCGEIGYAIVGGLCILGGIWNVISVIQNIGWWSVWAAIFVMDFVDLIQCVTSFYGGLICIQLWQQKKAAATAGQVVVVAEPVSQTNNPVADSQTKQ